MTTARKWDGVHGNPLQLSTQAGGFRPEADVLVCTYGAFSLSSCDLGLGKGTTE